MYDFLIVGSGLYGSVFAHQATLRGKKCLVIDKRSHLGGNVYCEKTEGINVHKYGPHVFHTNDKDIWQFVNSFVPFNNFVLTTMANYKGKLYNLPFNMNTFYAMWGVTDPEFARVKIKAQSAWITDPEANLEQQAIKLVGTDIYEILVKGYTEKQWGRPCTELPSFIIKRIPLRFTFDNNYFYDRYQGIPEGGYNRLIDGLLSGVEARVNTDFFQDRDFFSSLAKKVVYSGPIDRFFDYKFGELEYRSLRFEHHTLGKENHQGCAVMNYTAASVPYTRCIEHKHFEKVVSDKTVLTYEFPASWKRGIEPYYPINDEKNTKKYSLYRSLADLDQNIIISGRLGLYRYFDMHQIIGRALKDAEDEFNKEL